ncbi:MAG: translation initiation factor IF-2 [Chitinophagales bacterium]
MAETKKAVRLAKVAREINVGIDTITAHLSKKGFEVESKPTTKLSPEMYDILITDFKSSIALKNKANKISLRSKRERETTKVDNLEVVKVTTSDTPPPTNKRGGRRKDIPTKKEPIREKTKTTRTNKVSPPIDSPAETPNIVVSPPNVEVKKTESQNTTVVPEKQNAKLVEEKNEIKKVEKENIVLEKSNIVEPADNKVVTNKEGKQKALELTAEKTNIVVEEKKETKSIVEKVEPKVEDKIQQIEEAKPPQIEIVKEIQVPVEKKEVVENQPPIVVKESAVTGKEMKPSIKNAEKQEPTVLVESPETTIDIKNQTVKSEKKKDKKEIFVRKKPDNVISPPEIELAGPKVVGKIDLGGTNWKTRPDKKKRRKERKRRGTGTNKVVNKPQEQTKEEGQERNIKERPNVQLKGPKIVGKIDLSSDKKDSGEGSVGADGKRRRRRRKRIIKSSDKKVAVKKTNQPTTPRTPNEKTLRVKKKRRKKPQTSSKRTNEITEVSAKEIQDKIKATMAKLSGTSKGKSSRAKLRKQKREQAATKREAIEDEKVTNVLSVTEFISVNEFAKLMDVPVIKVITTCFNLGIIVSINQRLDAEVIELVADEFGFKAEFINVTEQDEEEDYFNDAPEDLEPRAPVVTVMGHVDHGKTSLLDYIRNANVIAGEMGGITQHIGAYEVKTESGKEITFLDTPGHEAFTAMRARGAKVTDIAVIVIAADDDIMPQTKEAISHAQAAGVPMIFAINKIDRSTALPEKIKEQLAAMNLLVEDWGGSYQSQEISAKFGTNIDELLEKILLEAELLELKANPNREAIGTVLEASLDKGRGYVSNILVQNGSLKVGDMVLAGQHVGKVKAMFNERGKRIKGEVGPATPVTILGLNGAPQAGDRVKVMDNEQEAKSIATKRAQIIREQGFRASKHITLEEIGRRLKIGTFKELNLIVKGDMDGSVEALTDSLLKLSTEEIGVNVIHRGVGAITESDVLLASASDAIIVGFQVRPTINARRNAEQESIEIRTYSIIYDAIEEIKSAMEGMLEPKVEERFVCNIEVRDVFKITKVGSIAGCYVAVGKVNKDTKIHLLRDGIIVYTGEIETLKRYKDDVKEVLPGQECGIRIKNYNDVKVGDVIEGFEEIEIKRTL